MRVQAILLAAPSGPCKVHHEEIAFVVERVLLDLEVGQRLPAELRQEREMFFAALERLIHRDHTVSEHPCLTHVPSYPIVSAASRKISRAMIRRWISLVPS